MSRKLEFMLPGSQIGWKRVGTLIAALLISLFSSVYASSPQSPIRDPALEFTPEERSTRLDLRLLAFLAEDHEKSYGPLEPTGRLRPLQELLDKMGVDHAQRMPQKDAWGTEYLYMVENGDVIFASTGPDGRPNGMVILMLNPPKEITLPSQRRAEFMGDDFIQSGATFLSVDGLERGRQKRTMADLRSIATAVEEYAIDNNAYPGPTRGLVDIGFLESFVAPIYIRELPQTDGWGERFFVWSTGQQYLLLSAGSDRLLDHDYVATSPDEIVSDGAFHKPEKDLVFANGSFVQWPEGTQSP